MIQDLCRSWSRRSHYTFGPSSNVLFATLLLGLQRLENTPAPEVAPPPIGRNVRPAESIAATPPVSPQSADRMVLVASDSMMLEEMLELWCKESFPPNFEDMMMWVETLLNAPAAPNAGSESDLSLDSEESA